MKLECTYQRAPPPLPEAAADYALHLRVVSGLKMPLSQPVADDRKPPPPMQLQCNGSIAGASRVCVGVAICITVFNHKHIFTIPQNLGRLLLM